MLDPRCCFILLSPNMFDISFTSLLDYSFALLIIHYFRVGVLEALTPRFRNLGSVQSQIFTS